MTELDLDQKLDMRRAFWAMGASTRVDVKLSALVPRGRGRAGAEEWTDLDVLAISHTPLLGTSFAIADCKTLKGRVTERVFWLRGVADLLGARSVFMTREELVPPASRQLALRLGINLLDSSDRERLLEHVGDAQLPQAGSFLKRETLTFWSRLTGDTPKGLERLQRYRRAGYWVAPRHRNLTFLPNLGHEASQFLTPRDRSSVAIVVDLAWLYLVSLTAALDEMARLHLSEPALALRQMVVGSEQELRERQLLAERLETIIAALPKSTPRTKVDVLPPYFQQLLDLAERLLRQRAAIGEILRVLEFTGVETIAGRGAPWIEAFPKANPIPVKLASDVVRFLVRSSSLDPRFVEAFTAALSSASADTESAVAKGLFADADLVSTLDKPASVPTIGDASVKPSGTGDEA